LVGSDAVDVGFHLNGFSEGSTVAAFCIANCLAHSHLCRKHNNKNTIPLFINSYTYKKEVTIKATSFPMEEKFIFY
jgi:hypothetical protein